MGWQINIPWSATPRGRQWVVKGVQTQFRPAKYHVIIKGVSNKLQ